MRTIFKTLFVSLLAVVLTACYDEYKVDFENGTSVYFSMQKPLRTLVEDDTDYLTFKFGVMIGGLYENERDWSVTYEIDESLLAESGVASELLPESYYTLSNGNNNTIIIPSGEFLGDVTVSIDKDKFMSDPKALDGTYALPLRIIESDSDSITSEMGETVIALKYMNKYHATYYLVGSDKKYEMDGATFVDEYVYDSGEENYVGNEYRTLTTVGQYELNVPFIGRYHESTDQLSMTFDFSNGDNITLKDPVGATDLQDVEVTSYERVDPYIQSDVTCFNVKYSYTKDEYLHKVEEEYIYLKRELKVEEWE